jgi:hypothetical protein
LVEDEREQHADGAVGEVEDAGRAVGQDQPEGRKRVDASDDCTQEQRREKRRHQADIR